MIEFDDRDFQLALEVAAKDYAEQALAQEADRAKRIRDAARRHAPRGETGELRDSIEVEEGSDDKGSYFDVGTTVEHGTYQEFGTSLMSAHPFMRPAIEENT